MDSFKTHSTATRNVKTVAITMLVMVAAAFAGLLVSTALWIFLEVVLLICGTMCMLLTARTYWQIELHGLDVILLNMGNHQSYCVDELSYDDFHIRQTPAQAAKDCCDLKIADYSFVMNDVQNCTSLKEYLQAHNQ